MKVLAVVLSLLVALCLALASPTAWAADTVRLRVGLYENSPKVGLSASGEPEGIFVDVLEAIARAEGWQLEYVRGTWREGLDALAAGRLDLMPDVAHSAERERLYAFHREPVLSSWSQVYVPRGNRIRALPDLDGRRVAVLEGSSQQRDFEQLAAAFGLTVQLVPQPDLARAFEAAASGRADAAVASRFYGERHAAAASLEDSAIVFAPTRLFFAAPQTGDPAILAAIDRRLAAYKRDPTSPYFASLRRWSAQDAPPGLPWWIYWTAMAVTVALAASAAAIVTLRRSARRLREGVQRERALSEALRTAKYAAETADRLKSAFLATMSHELRTPLNSIIGFTGIMGQELAGPLNDEQKRQIGMVESSSRHLLALINDVLDLSKIEAGELAVAHEPVDLAASIRRVIGIVTPLAAARGLALRAEGVDNAGTIVGDARRVEQILLNLIANAIKFTERGSVTLAVERGWLPPEAGEAAPQGATRIRVTDTGSGIREEDMDKLFRPFSQVDGKLSRRHDGTGLGLAISQRLAALMGGRIDVTSRWGEGSTFTLCLARERRALGSDA